MKIKKPDNVDIDLLCGMKVVAIDCDSENVAAAMNSAGEVLLRQSAICILAAAVSKSGWNSRGYLNDCVDLAIGILQIEVGPRHETILIRRYFLFIL